MKSRLIKLLFILALAFYCSPAHAQFSVNEISILQSLAEGGCNNLQVPVWNSTTRRWGCGAGGVGGGTVTSVGLTGTANQITVTGSTPITGAGGWTLSFPTNVTLPGTTTGTFSGSGASLTSLPAAQLTGTVDNARLDADLAALAAQNAAKIISGQLHQGIDAGGSDAYAACPDSLAQAGALTDGAWVNLRVNTVNAGNATYDGCSYGAKNIVKNVGGLAQTLADADMRAGGTYTLVYKSATTVWEVVSLLGNASADVTAGSNFGTDNSCIRADGVLKGIQATGTNCTISDAGVATVAGVVSAANTLGDCSTNCITRAVGGSVGARTYTADTAADGSEVVSTGTKTLDELAAWDSSGRAVSSATSKWFKAYWDAFALIADGTQCADAVKVTIASGPTQGAVICADNAGSIYDGNVILTRAITTLTFSLKVNDTASSAQHFAGGFKAQCRASGVAQNNTWGTPVTVDITMTTASVDYIGTTAAHTPNGTCSSGATLYWKFTMDATANTDDGNARVLGVLALQAS